MARARKIEARIYQGRKPLQEEQTRRRGRKGKKTHLHFGGHFGDLWGREI